MIVISLGLPKVRLKLPYRNLEKLKALIVKSCPDCMQQRGTVLAPQAHLVFVTLNTNIFRISTKIVIIKSIDCKYFRPYATIS